ncbi:MAG: aminodeoxychorismate lyase [Amphritea sp.]
MFSAKSDQQGVADTPFLIMAKVITSLVNGQFSNSIDLQDRGLAYGHGLFETVALVNGRAEYWQEHLARLLNGSERLHIPYDTAFNKQLEDDLNKLLQSLDQVPERLVLKVILTRGQGGRGYAVNDGMKVNRILLLANFPDFPDFPSENGIEIHICKTALARNPQLAGIKHLNRLEQVLARAEWSSASIREGVVCDTSGVLVEGTMSNLFWVKGGQLYTPDLSYCGVNGIVRGKILQFAARCGIQVKQGFYALNDLQSSDEVFFTNSLIGIWPVISCADKKLSRQWMIGPVTQQLQQQLAAEGMK